MAVTKKRISATSFKYVKKTPKQRAVPKGGRVKRRK